MTTFAELLTDLYTITNKPNLISESTIAIRKATIEMHCVAFFSRDLVEGIATLDPAGYNHALPLFARMRGNSFEYLRKYDSVLQVGSEKLTHIEAADIFDAYGVEKSDVYYIGGATVNIRSSTSIGALKYGYYAYPVVTPSGSYSSWVADNHSEIIIEAAAERVFTMIGDLEQANKMREAKLGNAQFLINNYLSALS